MRHPFSRSYGVILPSSLTKVLPNALGFSPYLPVSVCGTGTLFLDRGFSWQCRISYFPSFGSPSLLRIHVRRICLSNSLIAWTHMTSSAITYLPASPRLSNEIWWHWNFYQLSIAYALRPRLRSRLTLRGRAFLRKPWVFGEDDSHIFFRYLYQHSHFYPLHCSLRYSFSANRTLPYHEIHHPLLR